MKRILTAVILVPLILLLVFKAPLWGIALVTCIVALLATHEYLHIVRQYGVEPLGALTYFLVAALFGAVYLAALPQHRELWVIVVPSAAPFLYLVAAMGRSSPREALPAAAYSTFGLLYIGLSLSTLIFTRSYGDGVFWIMVLFATVWAGDSVAMYVGKAFGRNKLAPRISPNKTWEGSLGSVAGSLLVSFLVLHFRQQIDLHARPAYPNGSAGPVPGLPGFFCIVILLNIAGQLGDLVESVIKRGADVKDSGSLLPGHGGMLDRIDALLFAAPVLWYYLFIIRSLRPSW